MNVRPVAIASLMLAIPNCGASVSSTRAPDAIAAREETSADRALCHVGLPGAQISAAEFPDGLILTYSTEPNDVTAVRDVVRRFVEQQNQPRPGAAGPVGKAAIGPGVAGAPPGTTILLPGTKATTSPVPTGVRLVLAPVPPRARELLRSELAQHHDADARQPCPPASRLSG